jgi:hypothetical protein
MPFEVCIFSLVVDEISSRIRAKIYIIDGHIRQKIIDTLAIHCGIGCAIISDTIGRTHLRCLSCASWFGSHGDLLPQLLYTRWMMNHCSLRIKRDVFGLPRGKRCEVCGDMHSWGLDTHGKLTCILCYSMVF